MAKKVTTIRVDGELLDLARKEIPNLSYFIEECLRAYFGMKTETFNISDIQNELDKIKQSSLNIHILSRIEHTANVEIEKDKEKKNSAWLKLWGSYRNNRIYSEITLSKTSEVLEKEPIELINIMNFLLDFLDKEELVMCDDWEYVQKKCENY